MIQLTYSPTGIPQKETDILFGNNTVVDQFNGLLIALVVILSMIMLMLCNQFFGEKIPENRRNDE